MNRKFADRVLHHRKKLKVNHNSIYINESLCCPMQFLSFKVRSTLKVKKIQSYNLWKSKLTLKCNGNDFVISHIDDLIDLNLAKPEDHLSFF